MVDFLVPFQTLLKSIVASLVLAEICLHQTWQVCLWFAVTTVVSPRDSSLKEAKRDYDSFSSFMFELADTKGAGSMWQPLELAALSLSVQMIWSIRQINFILDVVRFSCGTWFQCCAEQIDFRGIKSYTISQYLIQYGFWNTYHNLPFVLCCFPFPNSKPWLGGSCNKTPEVLTAELIQWQNDSIQFRPCCYFFPCAFGDFPGLEILVVIKCAK